MPVLAIKTAAGNVNVPNDLIGEAYTSWFYNHVNWLSGVKYRGQYISKNPLDMHIYQEIIWEVKPTVIIEVGTWRGGSALFFADQLFMLHALKPWEVITVDNAELAKQRGVPPPAFTHDRIHFLTGCSYDKAMVKAVSAYIGPKDRVLVSLDGSHEAEDVLKDMKAYHKFVPSGSYMVVEDTVSTPISWGDVPGPADAVEEFLLDHPEFANDKACEKFHLTGNRGGWLKRK